MFASTAGGGAMALNFQPPVTRASRRLAAADKTGISAGMLRMRRPAATEPGAPPPPQQRKAAA